MKHDDLRQQAVQALANYMHHEMFDRLPAPLRLGMPFYLEQADSLLKAADSAIIETADSIQKAVKRHG